MEICRIVSKISKIFVTRFLNPPNQNGTAGNLSGAGEQVEETFINQPTNSAGGTGRLTSDPYLLNCVGQGTSSQATGLSPLEAEKIIADRCIDPNWLANVLSNHDDTNTSQVEHDADFDCQKARSDFKAKIDKEWADLIPFTTPGRISVFSG